jgi:hypothetical protein
LESATQVYAENIIPVFLSHRVKIVVWDEPRGSRIVDQDVEAPKNILGFGNHGPACLVIGHVGLESLGLDAVFRDESGYFLGGLA